MDQWVAMVVVDGLMACQSQGNEMAFSAIFFFARASLVTNCMFWRWRLHCILFDSLDAAQGCVAALCPQTIRPCSVCSNSAEAPRIDESQHRHSAPSSANTANPRGMFDFFFLFWRNFHRKSR